MSGIAQTWQTIVDFFKNSGFSEILSTINFGTIITAGALVIKQLKKFKKSEIVAQSTNVQRTQESRETLERLGVSEENERIIIETLNKVSGLLLIVIQNSKISAEAKQQALNVYYSKVDEAKQAVKNVAEVVEPIVEEITKAIEEEVETSEDPTKEENPYLASVDELINETETTETSK